MTISIIGCGWLGLPLGKRLVKEGHHVLGSTTRQEKFEEIKEAGVTPVLLNLQPMPFGLEFNQLFEADCLIINIPPGRKKQEPSYYEEQIKYLKYLCHQHQVSRVIFVSSTSYYPDIGDSVTEETGPNLQNGSGEAIVLAEKQIKQIKSDLTILRCGGLMGGGRIPGKWFANKETPGSRTPVNYIHREDVIGIICHMIKFVGEEHQQRPGSELQVVNLVCPNHPTRKQVHERMAEKYGFEKPIWTAPEIIPHKIVTSRIQSLLGYEFQFPDPLFF